ncbi:CpsD/CapB family tyrosine-protein kinase [Aquimonas voraii]|uniref:Chromosome partitioning ATPase, Mrp family, contains Fe-S cluster n=1 Tax=Aquimonas voraii TaxID=265719 RepID=A0A1G7A8K0_9GAMM|nr:CpsD/CapB family tyrosine-protein kinase [Aquimonas voraii]SDE10807.1 Chromosome partitioning ATPase, Mrp family, contains Fe-S cluster [Aquimonas voraii]
MSKRHEVEPLRAAQALAQRAGALAPFNGKQLEARRIVSHDMPDSRPADAFRDLRTQLLARAGGGNLSLLVVPVAHGSGASFVAVNLASAMAFDERRTVILVDCCLRSPQLHRRMDLPADAFGLVDFLEGRVERIEQVVHPTAVPRVLLVPAGPRREASGDLLGSARMRLLLDSLRGTDEGVCVVLDAPAVAASPDARILSSMAELSVLVAGYGRDTPAAVQEAISVLDRVRLAGVAFNRVPH